MNETTLLVQEKTKALPTDRIIVWSLAYHIVPEYVRTFFYREIFSDLFILSCPNTLATT